MYRRIITAVLSLIMILSIFCMRVSAQSSNVISDSGNSDTFAKGVINSLGVTFLSGSEETVTRGDFILAVVSLFKMSGIGDKDVPYADVSADSPYYNAVKAAYNLSWISEATNFNPNNPITLEQALKIGIHAIGGERQAAFYGGYPVGYTHLANTLDLNENIDSAFNADLSASGAYILLYNLISSKTFTTEFSGNGDVVVTYGGSPILESLYDMYSYEGILYATSVTNLLSESDECEGSIVVGNEEFTDNKGFNEYIGHNVKVLYKLNGSKKVAVFVSSCETNTFTLNSDYISDFKQNTVYYDDLGKEKKLSLESSYYFVYNGKAKILTNPDITPYLEDESTVITFIDNDNDNKYDVLSVLKYNYTFINKYDLFEGFIYDMHSDSSLINLSDDNFKYTVHMLKNGQLTDATISDIAGYSVLACAISADKTYADIVICADKISGVISEATNDGKYIIGGNEYKTGSYFETYYTSELGEEATYYLGINGEIVAEADESDISRYGYIVDVAKETGLNSQILVKIFDQSGEFKVVGVGKSVKLDGIKKTDEEFFAFADGLSDQSSRFIRYMTNSEDNLSMIDTSENKVDDFNSYGIDKANDDRHSLHFEGDFYARGSKIFVNKLGLGKFNYANTKYVFVVPEEAERNNEELYRIASTNDIKPGADYILSLCAYNSDETGSPEAILATDGYLHTADSVAFVSAYGVVTKITNSVDEEGDSCYKVYLANSSGYKTLILPFDVANKYFVPNAGDVVSYATDAKDNINFMIEAFDLYEYKISPSYAAEASQLAFTCGFVYSARGGYVHYLPAQMESQYKAVCPQTVDFSKLRNVNVSYAKSVYIDVVRSMDGSEIKKVTVNSNPETKLRDIKTAGKNNASFIVNRLNYSSNQETYIFNIIHE